MTYEQINSLFKQCYNQNNWKQFLSGVFANCRLLATPQILTGIDSNVASQVQKLGYITLNQNGIERQIAVFDVTLAQGIVLERNRVGLRNLLRKYWKDIDAAFITYHKPESPKWRFTYISELTGYDANGEFVQLKTEPKRYTYVLGEGESTRTAAERFTAITKLGNQTQLDDVKEAFSVEKLSKAFFDEYKKHYDVFCRFMVDAPNIRQTIFNGNEKGIRDFNKKLLGRIVFLYFIQKKGWLGVPAKSEWGKGDFNFLTQQFENFRNKDLFYQQFLSPLFFETLNQKRENDIFNFDNSQFVIRNSELIKIPYLNGGLFEEDDKKHRNLVFPANLFKSLFDFFNQYNFTIYEDDPNDHTVAVDPEMLGHIFENLLEDNKDKGAYYTPKEIVHYMCQESLIEYLKTNYESSITNYELKPEVAENLITNFIKKKEIIFSHEFTNKTENIRAFVATLNKALDSVKICDPAIGSGAFPMGLLHEIFTAKQTLHTFEHGNTKTFDASAVKLNIIQNSIYGVDIEKGAVDIARLRFWLSLIVDEEKPKALPNLDYKIVVGNSLVSKLGDDIIDIDWTLDETSHGLFGAGLAKQKGDLLRKISKEQKEFFRAEDSLSFGQNKGGAKKALAADIRNLKIDLLITQLQLMVTTKGIETKPTGTSRNIAKQTEMYLQTQGWKNSIKDLQKLKTKPDQALHFFDWKLDFPEVMNEQVVDSHEYTNKNISASVANNNVGFDIVIGNPPYVSAVTMARDEETKKYFKEKYPLATGSYDLYLLFILKAINLSNQNGTYTWIIPNKFLIADYAKQSRTSLVESYGLTYSINVSKFNVFEGIGVYPIIIFGNKGSKKDFAELLLESYGDLEQRKFVSPTSLKSHKTLKEYGLQINAGATGFQAEQLKDIVSNKERKGSIPFAVSGNIDRYKWTNESVRYMGERYATAFINNSSKIVADSKWGFWSGPKIVIAGMTKVIEAVYVENPLGMGVGIYGIYDFKGYDPFCLTAILNSKYLTYYFLIKFKDKHLAGGYLAINKSTIEEFPLVNVPKPIQKKLAELSKKAHKLSADNKSIEHLEQEIDNLVYKLYELTYDEVKVIDPAFGLSQAEYEAIKLE